MFKVIKLNLHVWMDLAFWVCVIWFIFSKLFSHSFECLLYSPLGGNNQSEITLSTHRDLIIYSERQAWKNKCTTFATSKFQMIQPALVERRTPRNQENL